MSDPVHLDGVLADPIPMFELFAWTHLMRYWGTDDDSGRCPVILPRTPAGAYDLAPPHSLSRFAQACQMDEAEYNTVRSALATVEGFWGSLTPIVSATWSGPVVCQRFPTKHRRGRSALWADPYVQTLHWIRKHFGVEYPIILMEDDKWTQ